MRKIWAVTLKELRQVWRDPLSLLLLIGLPALMLVLYGFALNFDVRHVALAVQDRDLSAASREYLSAYTHSTYFDVVATLDSASDVEGWLERRIAKAVLVIPEGFSRELSAGRRAKVQLLLDGSDSMTATTVLGYAGAISMEANVRLLSRVAGSGEPPVGGVSYEPRIWFNPELRSTLFLVPGLIGFLLMLTAVLSTALSVVRESERGTMEQIRMAPVNTVQLILGKTLPYLGISYLATLIVLVAARLLFGVQVRGSYAALFVVTLLYLVGALAWGLFISTVARTQAFAFQLGLLTSLLPALLLSGFIFQIRNMPAWLQAITYVVPARYFLVVLRGIILKGTGLSPYWDQVGFLALYAAVFGALASLRLARGGAAK
jgi:ABC-2 type transport system permease protein